MMSKLRWGWEVEYHDGSVVKQYPDPNTEISFKEVEENKIRKFALISSEKKYEVNLKSGLFLVNGLDYIPKGITPNYGKFELIFFIRNLVAITTNGEERNHKRFYRFGYRHNGKVYLCILNPDTDEITLRLEGEK